ncbi:MAG: FAD-binding protein [Candidatus Puniceispirillales bacterium WSBS_2018_MAG_OTU23]
MRVFKTPSLPQLEPRDADDLLEVMAMATANKTVLELQGLGTRRGLGRPTDADQVLSLTKLNGITTYEPDELVLMAKAATPLKDVLKLLDGAGQMLAFDPPLGTANVGATSHDEAMGSIGGIIAANLAGPRRLVAGAVRDYVLGFSAVSGRGEAFQSGGRVMKNVTGYDLSKLMAGSFGTLAVMHDVIIKTMPKPEYAASIIIAARSIDDACGAIRGAFASSYEPTAGAVIPPQVGVFSQVKKLKNIAEQYPAAVIRVEGFSKSVASRIKNLSDLLSPYGEQVILKEKDSSLVQAELREVSLLLSQDGRVLWKISCPPLAGGTVLTKILSRPNCRAYADWAGGLIWVSHPLNTVGENGDCGGRALRDMLKPYGGHATLISAPINIRGAIDVFQPQPAPLFELSRRVKASFDPLGILNPGRIYDGI